MVRIGIVIVVAAVIVSMALAITAYYEYRTMYIVSENGDPVIVAGVKYDIKYLGNHEGTKDTSPEETFFQVIITAENLRDEPTRVFGGQFFLLDEDDKRHKAVFVDIDKNQLRNVELGINESTTKVTQFDIEFDDEAQYKVAIRPTKEQASTDTGIICVKNC